MVSITRHLGLADVSVKASEITQEDALFFVRLAACLQYNASFSLPAKQMLGNLALADSCRFMMWSQSEVNRHSNATLFSEMKSHTKDAITNMASVECPNAFMTDWTATRTPVDVVEFWVNTLDDTYLD